MATIIVKERARFFGYRLSVISNQLSVKARAKAESKVSGDQLSVKASAKQF